ncbi:MAG TPA: hypothetical protein PLI12_10245, partial [Acetobacteraceae bacterium]|nr:hypothetical protein [Acetobacteraceae bacterium]
GATIVSRHAGDMINEITLAMVAGIGLRTLAKVIHAYPTKTEAIRDAWLSRAHPLGTPLEIKSAHTTRTGTFAGLSPAGELLLQSKNRIEPVSTGDVMLGLR